MSFTQKIFTPEQCDAIYDASQKLPTQEDTLERFSYMSPTDPDDPAQQEFAKNFYNLFYGFLQESSSYVNSLAPAQTSIPIVCTSTPKLGKEWQFHRDDFEDKDMKREWTIILSLSEPEEYEGGEIIILGSGSESVLKLPKGWIAICPSENYVKYNEVTGGQRRLARWCIVSGIKDKTQFEINIRYNQLYEAFKDNLSTQADELFKLANNMYLNSILDKSEIYTDDK